jgi:hypothetical protein
MPYHSYGLSARGRQMVEKLVEACRLLDTRARLEQYLQKHPEDRAAIYNPYTVVKWQGDRLVAVPYQEEYKQFLEPMAKALGDAAASGDWLEFRRHCETSC